MTFLRNRVFKTESFGVKGLSGKGFHDVCSGCVSRQSAAASVGWITNECMTNVGGVDADLVRAAGFKIAINLGCGLTKCFNDADAGDGVAACVEQNGLFLAIGFVAGKLRGDLDDVAGLEADAFDAAQARVAPVRDAVAEGAVSAFGRVGGELIGETMVGGVGFGDDQQAGCVFVDAVNDAGPFFATDAREVSAEVMEKGINQGAGVGARGRVDNHARGFVHDEEVVVFVDNVERDRFGKRFDVDGIGDGDLEDIAFGDLGLNVC